MEYRKTHRYGRHGPHAWIRWKQRQHQQFFLFQLRQLLCPFSFPRYRCFTYGPLSYSLKKGSLLWLTMANNPQLVHMSNYPLPMDMIRVSAISNTGASRVSVFLKKGSLSRCPFFTSDATSRKMADSLVVCQNTWVFRHFGEIDSSTRQRREGLPHQRFFPNSVEYLCNF